MKHPTLLEGVLVALVLSLLAAPIVVLLHGLVGSLLAWKAVVVVIAYTYMCYLLVQRGRMSGRMTLGLLALAVLLAGVALDLRLTSMLLLCMTLIWSIRSFAYSRSLVSAVLQGGICVLGCGVALMVYRHSGSFALAIWSFFLVQAAFVLIPARLTRRPAADLGEEVGGSPDGFGRAHHAAEQALDRLATRVAR
jgi:signal transduction histidine kinase